ncbi:ABC transporter ATP-binding protein [Winogradskya consettensis]|uniref:Multidrug ABC transporter ATP-binding protein n=1 Tax=Winogradskya consettensis TaxID=113560 RepID=A0A919SXT9_9ACTN|nr:ABC transporter ATP-binding protein [Actinoplanes consettensis]GIM79008.1 multidrug ABC transporter ATP-binding protein [Actinoplanes consettensis]
MTMPVADSRQVWRAAGRLVRPERGPVAVVLALNGLAASAGLLGPWLLGRMLNAITGAHDTAQRHAAVGTVDRIAVVILAMAAVSMVLTRYARLVAFRFGERTAARVREEFLDRTLALPAVAVERASAGDLTARATTDVSTVASTLRDAMPDVLISLVQVLVIIVAVVLLDPILGACGVVSLAGTWVAARWYLRRARAAYLDEGAASSILAEELTATAAGARTVETLSLARRRITAVDEAVAGSRRARLRTLGLRTVLYPAVDISAILPVAAVLLIGGAFYHRSDIGTVVAAALYLRQLIAPLEVVLMWIEELQSSSASFARVEGLAVLAEPGPVTDAEPADDRIAVTDVRYAYDQGRRPSPRWESQVEARDVLHGIDLTVRPGERLAVVGASGAGKSTLGRLLAGIDRPRTGTVTVGGVPIADLGPERLREQVVLVTQEYHVFHDSIRGNLLIACPGATDAHLRAALDTVGAQWAGDLDTLVGGDAQTLDGAQAQQLALARVILADPHTVILDEATALLDPASARHTEHALAAVLEGRTVIAIAHRLQTAHDADRVAVMDAGTVSELGTHDELVAAGGTYAALWRSWHQQA